MLRVAIIGVRVRPPVGPNDRGGITGNAVFWATVPAGCEKFYANAETQSAFMDLPQAQLDDLRAGRVTERVENGLWDLLEPVVDPATGATTMQPRTLESLRPFLEQTWQAFQDAVNDHQWHRYGTVWDDTGKWTEEGIG